MSFRIYRNDVDITFDPAKDVANRAKHGVALGFGAAIFDDLDHIVLPSMRPVDGEERFKVVGLVDGRMWAAIYVVRNTVTRFISVRRSNDGEERYYRA